MAESAHIPIRLYLNQDLDKTEQFDKSKDVHIDLRFEDRDITLDDLKEQLKINFRVYGNNIKRRMKQRALRIRFFTYHELLDIENDDDLLTEIDNLFPDESDSDDDHEEVDDAQQPKTLELRVTCTKAGILHNPPPALSQPSVEVNHNAKVADDEKQGHRNDNNEIDTSVENAELKQEETEYEFEPMQAMMMLKPSMSPPMLVHTRTGRYYDHQLQQMAHHVVLQWDMPHHGQADDEKDSDGVWLFHIRELNTSFTVQKLRECTYTVKGLDPSSEYFFQIQTYSVSDNRTSAWSEPLQIKTPDAPDLMPTPQHVQIITLLPNRLFIQFDPGFVAKKHENIRYMIKEQNVYKAIPFGVAVHPRPFGGFNPKHQIHPNTQYCIKVYTANIATGKESLESEALWIRTPPANWLTPQYKPRPPSSMQATYDQAVDEIVLFWRLPPDTFGDLIQYHIRVKEPVQSVVVTKDLPFRMRRSATSLIVEITTICSVNNQDYASEPGLYMISAEDVYNIAVHVQVPVSNVASDDDSGQLKYNV